MRFWLFLLISLIVLPAGAVIRSNPPPDACPADKPLAYWEFCYPNEKDCQPGGFRGDFWKSTCYACDTDIEIPQYTRWSGEKYIEARCSEYCPNRFINWLNRCVLDTFWNRFKDWMMKSEDASGGYFLLLAFFTFPFIFMLAHLLRHHKKIAVVTSIVFLGINIPLRFIPLIFCLLLTVPVCVWIVLKDVYKWVADKSCLIKKRRQRQIIMMGTVILVSALCWIYPDILAILFLIIMPVYAAISLNRLSKKEKK